MTRPAWPLSIVPVFAVLTAFSGCGDDEGVPPPAAGEALTTTGVTGGLGGSDAGQPPTANFGRPCERSEDCGIDLLCLTASSRTLTQGGPPGGLCTAACNQDPSICSVYAEDARCVNFGSTSYCVQICDYGSTQPNAFDATKCHGRTDFACTPNWVSTGQVCGAAEDCELGQRCEGTCLEDVPVCMPRCNSDADCGGLFCDPRSGECVSRLPSGWHLAERCNVSMAEDPCRGSCGLLERSEGGRCDETCTLGAYPSCGVMPEPPDVGCAIPVNEGAGFGDQGYCAPLCDCTDDCPDQMVCVVAELDYLQRPGFCKSPEPGDRVRSSCGSGGAAGDAGEGTTGSSAGGGPSVPTGMGGNLAQAGATSEGGGSEGGAAGAHEPSIAQGGGWGLN